MVGKPTTIEGGFSSSLLRPVAVTVGAARPRYTLTPRTERIARVGVGLGVLELLIGTAGAHPDQQWGAVDLWEVSGAQTHDFLMSEPTGNALQLNGSAGAAAQGTGSASPAAVLARATSPPYLYYNSSAATRALNQARLRHAEVGLTCLGCFDC
jgi:hypothetical protein